jgi:UDP-N-acetyl-D-glucosamine dehydrogenase
VVVDSQCDYTKHGLGDAVVEKDLAKAIQGAEAAILAVPHEPYLKLEPEQIVQWAGGPLAVIDCFGILPDDKIRRYFELGCEVKALGRGHIQRIKKEVHDRATYKEGRVLPGTVTYAAIR